MQNGSLHDLFFYILKCKFYNKTKKTRLKKISLVDMLFSLFTTFQQTGSLFYTSDYFCLQFTSLERIEVLVYRT